MTGDQESAARAALIALQCLDLTSLNDADQPADIDELCRLAQTKFGHVAAVCVWPRFVAQARALLPATIKVAAVANFPHGSLDLAAMLADVQQIIVAGGDEVDVVLPYRALQQGKVDVCAEFLAQARQASRPLTLKVIIESGELATPLLIRQATRLDMTATDDEMRTLEPADFAEYKPQVAASVFG